MIMEYYGYTGNVLFVNLSSGDVRTEPLDKADAEMYLGGLGINNRLAYDLVKPGLDALSPENPIIIGAGPLVGTMVPGASRLIGTAKFPLSGAVSAGSGPPSCLLFALVMLWLLGLRVGPGTARRPCPTGRCRSAGGNRGSRV